MKLDELKALAKDAKVKGKNKGELLKALRRTSQKQAGLGYVGLKRSDSEISRGSSASRSRPETPEVELEPEGDLSVLDKYADADNVSDYAKEAMAWAIGNGIITGVSDDTLAPQNSATRAQIAAILMRYCEM